ncbi:MAG TPA: thioredoxin fold domain-containing protein [Holophaga sp.]|nr:thioredoxin fold domain-containing protein [Holophaga sp.]
MKTWMIPLLVAGSLAAAEPGWETSLPAAQTRARKEHKLIFLDIWTEWCGWCIRLQKDTFPSPAGKAALAKVVPLSLKTQLRDGTPTENKAYEQIFKVEGFPALYLLDSDGKVVSSQPGYLPPEPFAAWINAEVAKYK